MRVKAGVDEEVSIVLDWDWVEGVEEYIKAEINRQVRDAVQKHIAAVLRPKLIDTLSTLDEGILMAHDIAARKIMKTVNEAMSQVDGGIEP